ncbi:unnamed protein product [Microthlaspi erraticum]|uniref:Uncharacterized protein n=1 Tax=Microthlaspi erraticum TaxID=1685480 RepID=A0A6D2ISJ5_9BRAS|nr:unnamed protein product [Microthlaspi erraticum]
MWSAVGVGRDVMISVDRGPLPPGSDGAVVRPDRSWRRPSEANSLPVRPSAFGRLWTSLQYKRRQSFAAARHNPCTAADQSARTGRHRPVTGQVLSAKTYLSVRPRRPNTKTVDHDRSDRTDGRLRSDDRPIVPTDRPNVAVDPKPFLKPNSHNSSPKPAPTY